MHEICVIGDRDSILGFKALGFDIFVAETVSDAEKIIDKAAEKYAVIFITEKFAQDLKSMIDGYRNVKLPVIVPIPGGYEKTGTGMKMIRDAMERAVGADILFRDE